MPIILKPTFFILKKLHPLGQLETCCSSSVFLVAIAPLKKGDFNPASQVANKPHRLMRIVAVLRCAHHGLVPPYPIGSMHGIFTYIWLKFVVNGSVPCMSLMGYKTVDGSQNPATKTISFKCDIYCITMYLQHPTILSTQTRFLRLLCLKRHVTACFQIDTSLSLSRKALEPWGNVGKTWRIGSKDVTDTWLRTILIVTPLTPTPLQLYFFLGWPPLRQPQPQPPPPPTTMGTREKEVSNNPPCSNNTPPFVQTTLGSLYLRLSQNNIIFQTIHVGGRGIFDYTYHRITKM